MKRHICLSLALIFLLTFNIKGQGNKLTGDKEKPGSITVGNGTENLITVKVIYDNYTVEKELTADWGYSILIEGLEKSILFDTGTKPEIFESNFRKMGLDPDRIEMIVLSHEHNDHTGGIPAVVKLKTGIPVLIPVSFSEEFKKELTEYGFEPVMIDKPAIICKDLYTSGEFECQIPEQSLVLNTRKGLVIMTGCSHPGIIEMLKDIEDTFSKNIYMVFGGFHLMNKSKKEMDELIREMKSLGVIKCGATHCTGEMQIGMFKDSFGENFFDLGVGNTIEIR